MNRVRTAGKRYPRWQVHWAGPCHHLGRVYAAAVPLTTAQLIASVEEADRLNVREAHGAWQPVSQGFAEECPDSP
ncbi:MULTISPECIES: hypothetical protein [unclassified Streptomyces]|uniref:hypothetical protein n=1 Tax=unclassified Streptomyces TaxID=2593676 RepID=UPI002E2B127E|nr:hypothetical protein [Streptomyces sp. NBC_00273]